MSDERFDLHADEIEDLLSGYGQDLAMRGAKPGEQRFGAPEIALALIPIMSWFLQTVLKALIEHEVKRRLEKREKQAVPDKLADLEARISRLEALVAQATRHELPVAVAKEELARSYSETMQLLETADGAEVAFGEQQKDGLVEVLQDRGLTHRRASQLSAEILGISAGFIPEARREHHEC